MSARAPGFGQLSHLPHAEVVEHLQALVVDEIRTTLALGADDPVPPRASFVDELSLSSLRLMEIKRRLEAQLGCEISANVLFNRPTVDDLVAYLVALLGLGGADPAAPRPGPPRADQSTRSMVNDMLDEIYGS